MGTSNDGSMNNTTGDFMITIAVATMCICACICACYWHSTQQRKAGTSAQKADESTRKKDTKEFVQHINLGLLQQVDEREKIVNELLGDVKYYQEQSQLQTDCNETLEAENEVLQNEVAVLTKELQHQKDRNATLKSQNEVQQTEIELLQKELRESRANCAALTRTREIPYAN